MKYTFIFPLVAIAMLLSFPVIIVSDMASAQPSESNGSEMSQQNYGCTLYGQRFHCDPILSEFESREVVGNSVAVNPITSNQTLYVEGKSGQALEMIGSYRESVEIGNSETVNPDNFSVSFWIKPTSPEPYGNVVAHSNRANTAGWMFDVASDTTRDLYGAIKGFTQTIRFGVFNSEAEFISPQEIQIDPSQQDGQEFTHITGTFNGTQVSIYKNGILHDAVEFTGEYSADPGIPVRMGSAAYCTSCNRWSGVIDDVKMYSRTLSDNEVRELFDSVNAVNNTSVTDGLVGHWSLDGDTSDSSGNNNHGTTFTMVASMAFAPDGRLFYTEKNTGQIRIINTPIEQNSVQEKPFAVIEDPYVSWEQGLLGIAIDPKFEQNHYVYVYYAAMGDSLEGGTPINKVVRFTEVNNTGSDRTIIIDNIPASRGYHSGGALAFGPDDKLYVTVGDATEHPFAQDPAITIGKILRVNRDGSIPADNPYPNSPVFTVGHRNMYGIAFDQNGEGIITENGDYAYDEINRIHMAGNYGFPTLQTPNRAPELSDNNSIKPIRSYFDTIAPTQMIYYDGDKVPMLKDKFLFGTYTGDIYVLDIEDNKLVSELKIELSHYPFVPVVAIAQSPDGGIYYGGYEIFELESIDETESRQLMYPIDFVIPNNVEITNVQTNAEQRFIAIDLKSERESPFMLQVQIPRGLLDSISTATMTSKATGEETAIGFDLVDNPNGEPSSRISMNIDPTRIQPAIDGDDGREFRISFR